MNGDPLFVSRNLATKKDVPELTKSRHEKGRPQNDITTQYFFLSLIHLIKSKISLNQKQKPDKKTPNRAFFKQFCAVLRQTTQTPTTIPL